jgi:integrase
MLGDLPIWLPRVQLGITTSEREGMMAAVRKKPNAGGKYQGYFKDYLGRRVYFTGTKSRPETIRIAKKLEEKHRLIRLGYMPLPQSANKHRSRDFSDVVAEHLDWGNTQGGRGGRPWGKTHARHRKSRLLWWIGQIKLDVLGDLEDTLPQVEKALRELKAMGRAGKTLANYAEAISAFCDWCVKRGYLEKDPLHALERFDTSPIETRRALTIDEINRLLGVCAHHTRLLFETAFLSGLRANELRSLSTEDLDVQNGGLHLRAEWTKNRQKGFQPLPRNLMLRLSEFAESGEASRIYDIHYARKDAVRDIPDSPLLYVPTNTARVLDEHLKKAGIPKRTPEGKLDFHACRNSYITLITESDATLKEAQTLARHSTPQLTMNIYSRVREGRLSEVVEKAAEKINPDETGAI